MQVWNTHEITQHTQRMTRAKRRIMTVTDERGDGTNERKKKKQNDFFGKKKYFNKFIWFFLFIRQTFRALEKANINFLFNG